MSYRLKSCTNRKKRDILSLEMYLDAYQMSAIAQRVGLNPSSVRRNIKQLLVEMNIDVPYNKVRLFKDEIRKKLTLLKGAL